MSDRPIGIDLFAGAGGMSLGFEQAGFDIVASVEIDPIHCAVHEYNFPKTKTIPFSVENLTGSDIRRLAGIGDQTIDCVFGGAPCQGFSLIGQRLFDDPRNKLVGEFVRLVKELEASSFVFENVKGLTLGKHKKFLNMLVSEFQAADYHVRLPWKVLNAADFGVPQNRERLFLFGSKHPDQVPHYPHIYRERSPGQENKPPTVEQAISDLPDADKFTELLNSDSVSTKLKKSHSKYAIEMRCQTTAAWHNGYRRIWNTGLLTSSARTNHSEISKRRFSETEQGKVEPISRFFRLAANGISNTLRAGTDGSRGAFTSPRPIHYKYPRCVTVREMARLHGFPDWFRFNATKWHGARQIGNSVPPPLARSVAVCVIDGIGAVASPSNEVLKLGNPELLDFSLSQASAYFGVETPPNRRDRKSGNKKRKQEDIEAERHEQLKDAANG